MSNRYNHATYRGTVYPFFEAERTSEDRFSIYVNELLKTGGEERNFIANIKLEKIANGEFKDTDLLNYLDELIGEFRVNIDKNKDYYDSYSKEKLNDILIGKIKERFSFNLPEGQEGSADEFNSNGLEFDNNISQNNEIDLGDFYGSISQKLRELGNSLPERKYLYGESDKQKLSFQEGSFGLDGIDSIEILFVGGSAPSRLQDTGSTTTLNRYIEEKLLDGSLFSKKFSDSGVIIIDFFHSKDHSHQVFRYVKDFTTLEELDSVSKGQFLNELEDIIEGLDKNDKILEKIQKNLHNINESIERAFNEDKSNKNIGDFETYLSDIILKSAKEQIKIGEHLVGDSDTMSYTLRSGSFGIDGLNKVDITFVGSPSMGGGTFGVYPQEDELEYVDESILDGSLTYKGDYPYGLLIIDFFKEGLKSRAYRYVKRFQDLERIGDLSTDYPFEYHFIDEMNQSIRDDNITELVRNSFKKVDEAIEEYRKEGKKYKQAGNKPQNDGFFGKIKGFFGR